MGAGSTGRIAPARSVAELTELLPATPGSIHRTVGDASARARRDDRVLARGVSAQGGGHADRSREPALEVEAGAVGVGRDGGAGDGRSSAAWARIELDAAWRGRQELDGGCEGDARRVAKGVSRLHRDGARACACGHVSGGRGEGDGHGPRRHHGVSLAIARQLGGRGGQLQRAQLDGAEVDLGAAGTGVQADARERGGAP